MNQIKYIKGDLFELLPKEDDGNTYFIPHVTNNTSGGCFGSGFVIPLKKRWPITEKVQQLKPFLKLGDVETIRVEPHIFVSNMTAQTLIGEERPLKYAALVKCMERVAEDMDEWFIDNHADHKGDCCVLCPRFGTLRAGGNARFIEDLIEEIWLPHFPVTIVEYQEKNTRFRVKSKYLPEFDEDFDRSANHDDDLDGCP